MNVSEIDFSELEDLANTARYARFLIFKSSQNGNDITPKEEALGFVAEQFLVAWAKGDFERLFVTWYSGLAYMHRKNLVQALQELTEDTTCYFS